MTALSFSEFKKTYSMKYIDFTRITKTEQGRRLMQTEYIVIINLLDKYLPFGAIYVSFTVVKEVSTYRRKSFALYLLQFLYQHLVAMVQQNDILDRIEACHKPPIYSHNVVHSGVQEKGVKVGAMEG